MRLPWLHALRSSRRHTPAGSTSLLVNTWLTPEGPLAGRGDRVHVRLAPSDLDGMVVHAVAATSGTSWLVARTAVDLLEVSSRGRRLLYIGPPDPVPVAYATSVDRARAGWRLRVAGAGHYLDVSAISGPPPEAALRRVLELAHAGG